MHSENPKDRQSINQLITMIDHIVPSYSLDILALILTASGNLNFCQGSSQINSDCAQVLSMQDSKISQNVPQQAYCKMVSQLGVFKLLR